MKKNFFEKKYKKMLTLGDRFEKTLFWEKVKNVEPWRPFWKKTFMRKSKKMLILGGHFDEKS